MVLLKICPGSQKKRTNEGCYGNKYSLTGEKATRISFTKVEKD